MLIYRFERKGRGMFRSSPVLADAAQRWARDNRAFAGDIRGHPGPYSDCGLMDKWLALKDTSQWFFGGTLEQLRMCFVEELWEAFAVCKGEMVAYKVNARSTRKGTFQTVFRMDRATRVAAYVPDYANPLGTIIPIAQPSLKED